ncbi:DUF3052 family protein [Devosia sp.]|uniref:DUF3052 family protein n=1 Tax=Devosia sp. TaxID=1871048 RepID=UPI003267020A
MSGKPVLERLQVKAARTIAVLAADGELDTAIGGADRRGSAGQADVVLVFLRSRADLRRQLGVLPATLRADVILWIAYPKLTSKLAGDLNRDAIHGLVEQFGLSTVTQIAIDADWSAMRLRRHG